VRSAVRSRRSGANSPAGGRAGATRRFTPPGLNNCAGGVNSVSKEIESYGPSLRTGSPKGGAPRANCNLAEGRKRTWSAGRGLRDDLRLHLPGSPTGRAVMALRPVTNAAARAERDLPRLGCAVNATSDAWTAAYLGLLGSVSVLILATPSIASEVAHCPMGNSH
jgi:hypothetical protein